MNIEEEIMILKQRVSVLEGLLASKPISHAPDSQVLKCERDKTKYIYNGKIYPKNRLVLAIVQDYCKSKSPTFNELSQVFDKSLQGSLNVVETINNALRISDCTKRYFMNEKDVITLIDNTKIVVCTQWGIFNIKKFIKQSENLGFDIQSI